MFDDHENAKKHRADAKTTYAIKTGFDVLTTGSSDVNSDSSDAHSASVAMSLTATILRHPDVG